MPLEPEAAREYGIGPAAIQYSQAISLRRIADAIEKLMLVPPELLGVNKPELRKRRP